MLRLGLLLCLVGFVASSPPVTKSRRQIEAFKEALERSRIDDGILLESRMLENPKANVWENSGKFQGDILLDDEQIEDLVADYAGVSESSGGRAAYVRANTRWPGNVVPYEMSDEFTASERDLILMSIRWIQHFSCVRFRVRTPQDRNFVRITGRQTGCYAHVGFNANRGAHTCNLARRGCLNNIIIIHEFLHNLGFFHMQSAYERYNYVRINWQNIREGTAHNFYRINRNLVNLLQLPYEYQSSMHYSTHAFSSNGQPTIVATRSFPGTMGHMVYVTHWDWVRLRRHYNCPGAWDERAIQELKEEVDRTLPLMMADGTLTGRLGEDNNESAMQQNEEVNDEEQEIQDMQQDMQDIEQDEQYVDQEKQQEEEIYQGLPIEQEV